MSKKAENLTDIQIMLSDSGYQGYANLLSYFLEKNNSKGKRIIGFVGDELVGKSTVINMLLGERVLPTSIIPTYAELTVKYGDKAILLRGTQEETDISKLSELIDEEVDLNVTITNDFLRDNGVEFKEFHGVFGKQKSHDIVLMSYVYKCDAIVLVMSAEHFLSETERTFIENFVKYVGNEHILLVLNKLAFVNEGNIEHVLEYAQKQITKMFPGVSWCVFDNSGNIESIISTYSGKDVKSEILRFCNSENSFNNTSADNLLEYIKEQLKKDVKKLNEEQNENEEKLKNEQKKLAEQKAFEKSSVDDAIVEFRQRKISTADKVDKFIKEQFDAVAPELVNSYLLASNKYEWYENELEKVWKVYLSDVSSKTDEYASDEILKDIEWLNTLFQTKLGVKPIVVEMPEENLKKADKVVPYGNYKKIAPIGIGGSTIIGYCLFRIVGAAIGLGCGILAYSYLNSMDTTQDEEIKREITSMVRDISSKVRKLSKEEIEKIYDNVISEFKREAKNIIDSKYRFSEVTKSDTTDQIIKLSAIINKIEEE